MDSPPCMSLTHARFSRPCATVRLFRNFLDAQTATADANSTKEQPCSHQSDQYNVLLTLPSCVVTEIANIARA